jgi:hypothetical protein
MARNISMYTRKELVEVLGKRYVGACKKEKTRILDEFTSVAGYHRKHAVRLLRCGEVSVRRRDYGRRIYDEAVREALVVAWEASDRICGKRLKVALPILVAAMERHGHVDLDPEVRSRLLSASAATLDRLLAPIRSQATSRRGKPRSANKVSRKVRVRTYADWGDPEPGYLEIDFVEHNGGSTSGAFLRTLVATDVCTGWTECVSMVAKDQHLVVEALEIVGRQVPFAVLGIDSDNEGAFINDTLLDWCERRHVEFTRSRAYRKNDQAWVEQKNGAVVRGHVGHGRLCGVVAGRALAHLYQAVRLYVNHFQPSFKLVGKEINGSKVKRLYDQPATPCERVLRHPAMTEAVRERLREAQQTLDPVALLHSIREQQAALSRLACPENAGNGPGRKSLEQFTAQLGELWRLGEVRPTHRKAPSKPRWWRTRKDPFESVWHEVLLWFQDDPDTTAKALFERLQGQYPDRFVPGQLRTLQRRLRDWRQVVARELVYAGLTEPVTPIKAAPAGVEV